MTYLHDHEDEPHAHDWHQLTFASGGNLEVHTAGMRSLIPADGAIWVPAGLEHRELMHAPVSVRSLYVAPGAMPDAVPTSRTLGVSPLLREMILHITREGALDRRTARQARLIDVLIDLVADMPEVPMQLPTPHDPRARRLIALLEGEPGRDVPIAALAREAGASPRTIERIFLRETSMSVGEWRRRFRLLHGLAMLEGGATVTETAFEIGYATVSAFSAAFRRQFGCPPTRWARGARV